MEHETIWKMNIFQDTLVKFCEKNQLKLYIFFYSNVFY